MPGYDNFKTNIDRLININLNYYKEAQMKRRIKSLMNRNKIVSFHDYYRRLATDDELLEEFINYLTINVSEFYRNPTQWQVLEKDVIPYLMENNKGVLSVWSCACSTGEEPYSLVMLLSKFYPLNRIRVLATDIDTKAIDKAKKGIYTKKALDNLPEEYIKKYFTRNNKGLYIISDEIKKCVEFRKIDLLKDDFPKSVDLISCRNVMIYFTDEAKRKLYVEFNKSLKSHGIFFVGSTEQIIMPEKYNFTTFETFFYKIKEKRPI